MVGNVTVGYYMVPAYLFGGCDAGFRSLAEYLNGILGGSLVWIYPVLAYM